MVEHVRVLRLIEYTGPRADVEQQVLSSLHGQRAGVGRCLITATTLSIVPEHIGYAPALTEEESKELHSLAFIVVADLPMSDEQYSRYNALKTKRDTPIRG